jgi:polyisoprenoid-binding protein YceI
MSQANTRRTLSDCRTELGHEFRKAPLATRKGEVMKSCSLLLALSILTLGVGCQKSEIDEKPAAEVSETSATSVDTVATSTQPTPGAVTEKVTKEKSRIDFVGAKVTRDHKGQFRNFDGWIEYAGNQPSRIAFEIDLNSIETDEAKLTAHLKTPDFFDVAKYPKATFVSTSTSAAPTGSPGGATHIVKGILNLHGVEREVTIPVVTQVTPEGVRAKSEFTINRHDWGISYRGMADDLIKDNVLIKLDLVFPPAPAVV